MKFSNEFTEGEVSGKTSFQLSFLFNFFFFFTIFPLALAPFLGGVTRFLIHGNRDASSNRFLNQKPNRNQIFTLFGTIR